MDGGEDGCIIVGVRLMPLNCTLENGGMVKCMIYAFYHNEKLRNKSITSSLIRS